MAINHIACAVDGSESAQRAVNFAAEMSVAIRARLTLVSVRKVVVNRSALNGLPTPEDVDARLAVAEGIASKAGCSSLATIHLHGSEVADLLAQFAAENSVHLMVMGCKVKTAMQRLALGSTAMHFIRQSRCPITLVQ